METYGFEYLGFKTFRLDAGASVQENTGDREIAIVLFGGKCSVQSSAADFPSFGGRASVFDGLPYTLYLPIATDFTLTADTDCDLAICYSKAEVAYPAKLVTPADVRVEIRGGGNATRQINHMLEPSFGAQRLLICEVYTPSGNWSSYPPHKHDVHNPPGEVDLEEIYYYRIDKPEGYAIQKVYTQDRRIDETITARDGDLILVPEGYHPVVAAHGYNAYYLNALAGSARSMAASDDPQYAWVRGDWRDKDPRVPVVR
jgi:5-deoxy-glucuronate isomerase